MVKKLLSVPQQSHLIIVFAFFICSQYSYSQCVSANPIQNYCANENKTVNDLQVTSGINVVWYDSLTGGNQFDGSTPLENGISYYAEDIDASCTDTTRFEVTVFISGEPPTNVDVFVGKCASENPIIQDLSATGTAIEWYSEQNNGTLLAATTPLENGKTYWVQQTENGCTSERLPTTVNLVNPDAPTLESVQYFCAPPNPTVANLKAVESNIVWYSSETSTTPLSFSTPLINGEEYWASLLTFPCESTERSKTTVVLDTAPNAGTDGSYTACELNLTTTNLFTLLGGTPEETGTWTGPSNLSGGYLGTFDPSINTEGIYTYSVSSTLGICPNETATVEVTILKVQAPTTENTTQTFCEINDPTIASLTATGTGILWYATETSTTALNPSELLISGEDYWASQTETTGCESIARLQVYVNIITPLPPTTSEISQTFCEIDNPTIEDLVATGTGILWYPTETSTIPLDTTEPLINGEEYWATQTESTACESANRLKVLVSIIKQLPPITSEINQTFCEIDNPTIEDLVATGTALVWYATETSTVALNSTEVLINGEDYWATQTETSGCESKNRLQVTVAIQTPLPPTTLESIQTFCEIDNPTVIDLIAAGTDITWYESETSTTALNSTDALIDGEDYWATQTTNNCESIDRLKVTVSILKPLPPTTTEMNQTFCEIDNPTIQDIQVSGTAIVWYASETSTIALDENETLINGEDYWAAQIETNGCESASRLVVNTTVLSPLPPTTTETTQSFCEIDAATIADLTITGSGVLWYDTETATTPLDLTEVLIDGEDYWASQTETTGCESTSRLVVKATILVELPPTTTETTQTFCEIDSPTISNLMAVGNNITWYDTETSTTPLDTTEALINGEDYWATQSAGTSCESDSRLVVTAQITATLPPTTTEAIQTFCTNYFAPNVPTIANLNASGTNILWYLTETSTTPLDLNTALIDEQFYWATQTDSSGCESATRLSVNVNVIHTPNAITENTNQTFCAANNPSISNISVSGDSILWFDTESSTTPLNTTETLIDGEDYWALNTDAITGCESSNRLQITVTITEVNPPVINNLTQTFCEATLPTIADLEPSNSILWFTSETGTTPLNSSEKLVNNTIYWAAAVNTSGCLSSEKIAVTVQLIDAGTPILETNGNEFCKIDNPILADLDNRVTPQNNGTITWYTTYPNGTPLNLSEALDENETYYAVETNGNGCPSAFPLEIIVDLEVCNEYDVVIYDGFSPNGDGINDTFKIENLRDLYPDFNVQFFNRWGNLIYTANANNADWNGRLNGNGEFVTAGVYYFIINFNKNNRKPLQDRLYLSR
ncbi:gliding motility-associated C-terminal domain-containing protein [Lutibacter holmesii]|uniref:Gliding motility-associated C-terminal domain-containing protein n=1 Tax=Lutibacter holmesii TaxID=1137985 RepID=A0ABW3WM84_9FLAO